MNFENTLAFAKALDQADELAAFRHEFLFPQQNGKTMRYFCGNSLGLQPVTARAALDAQLANWQQHAVEGWFTGQQPWMFYHKELKRLMAPVVGATEAEVCPMNTLTVNLHLLLVSFYRPDSHRFKILMEAGAFPSDQYAIESQIRFHGLDPAACIVEVSPRPGEQLLRTQDILDAIHDHRGELALVLFGGINYYTGQLYDLEKIAGAARGAGARVGFDLAHAAGNVPLALHDWQVDFACWCSYKYQNAGPGGIAGIFVHERHFDDRDLKRFAGWWGYEEERRFLMQKGFVAGAGADGWQVSCTQVLPMSLYHAALLQFERAGFMEPLRRKSMELTAYLYWVIGEVNRAAGSILFEIITPAAPAERGAQLSIVAKNKGKEVFDALVERQFLGDWREPDVIRLSPVPLYNSFEDVYLLGEALHDISSKLFAS
ncbi:kynureninase [Pedobacter yulinensis]|uniref:Kynureninase n=1 Tax=Pedobacter yulinensis TaxID=2126353 RepID=A0A2T3HL84_9SPHI|nr:kynureninase [Pedobacter yulinensis]PST83202.1 kynureninase [Pedobacter yulinensis]